MLELIEKAEAFMLASNEAFTADCPSDPCPYCTAGMELQTAILDAKDALVTDTRSYSWSARKHGSSVSGGGQFRSADAAMVHAIERAHETFGTDQTVRTALHGRDFMVEVYAPADADHAEFVCRVPVPFCWPATRRD